MYTFFHPLPRDERPGTVVNALHSRPSGNTHMLKHTYMGTNTYCTHGPIHTDTYMHRHTCTHTTHIHTHTQHTHKHRYKHAHIYTNTMHTNT